MKLAWTTSARSFLACAGGSEAIIEARRDGLVQLGEEVAVAAEGDVHRRVAHPGLYGLGVAALGDGHAGVAEVVEPAAHTDPIKSGLEVALLEARREQRAAGLVREHQRVETGLGIALEVLGQDLGSHRGDRDRPEQIGLLSLRTLVPVMQALAVTRSLNFLNAEALGAALLLGATIAVSVDAPLLRAGATDLAVDYRLLARAPVAGSDDFEPPQAAPVRTLCPARRRPLQRPSASR